MYIVLTVHLDFICIKLFWILILRQWHPHPTTGQVLQSSPTPHLISEEELNVCFLFRYAILIVDIIYQTEI
jgi:hypothetical protein